MTAAVVYTTDGIMDLRAMTTFGLRAKPRTESPIGYFGTGLKFAVATLVRAGCGVTVWLGSTPHVFYTRAAKFRGTDFAQVYLKRRTATAAGDVVARWRATRLPYTTELGRDWQVWMALRELHCNTLDEHGCVETHADGGAVAPLPGCTRVVVTGDPFVAAYEAMDEVVLPDCPRDLSSGVWSAPRPSKYGYYRGLRARELPRQALRTWSVHDELKLTEDRTVRDQWSYDYAVRNHVWWTEDEALIKQCLTAPEHTYEGHLDWEPPSSGSAFARCAARWGRRHVRHYGLSRVPELLPRLDWRRQLVVALDRGDDDPETLGRAVLLHKVELTALLERSMRGAGADADPVEEELPF